MSAFENPDIRPRSRSLISAACKETSKVLDAVKIIPAAQSSSFSVLLMPFKSNTALRGISKHEAKLFACHSSQSLSVHSDSRAGVSMFSIRHWIKALHPSLRAAAIPQKCQALHAATTLTGGICSRLNKRLWRWLSKRKASPSVDSFKAVQPPFAKLTACLTG